MHRPAPVQVDYLGYPGTLGVPYIDYIVADAFVIPAGDERWYSEQVVRLPDSYQVNDSRRAIDDHTPSRADARAARRPGSCSAGSTTATRSLPECSTSGCGCCERVEGSVLWLLADNEAATRNLRREAARRGIAPERLVFAPRAKLGAIWRGNDGRICSSTRCRATRTRRRATRSGQGSRC